MKNSATSYSDFFKDKSMTPGDPEDSNGKITKSSVAVRQKSRGTDKDDDRNAAIKRRLKLTAGRAMTKARRRS